MDQPKTRMITRLSPFRTVLLEWAREYNSRAENTDQTGLGNKARNLESFFRDADQGR